MQGELSYQIQLLLKQNNLIFDFNELAFQIKSHPTYPSLHAVTGVLDYFNIENLALDVPVTSETLRQLPNTFLAQIKIDKQKQLVTINKIKTKYMLVFDSKTKKVISASDFLDQFTGIVLAVDKKESNVEPTKTIAIFGIVKWLSITSLILFGLLLFISNTPLANYLFLSLSVIGIYIAATLIKQEQGESTFLSNTFCSNPNGENDCNTVLSSKAATLIHGIKLSDLSFIYFTGMALASSILIISNASVFIPKLISIIALPVTFFSIYYQSIVLKKWCFLCLSIVTVMWLQAGLFLTKLTYSYDLTSITISILCFTGTGALWLLFFRFYKDNQSLKKIRIEYFKFKRNFELFNSQLSKSKPISTLIENTEEIIFGHRHSNFHITVISNPLCGHCRVVHDLANQIIKRYSDKVKLTIRFKVNTKDPQNLATKIALRLLELYHAENPEACLKAMDDIYGDYSIDQWLNTWEAFNPSQDYLSILEKESDWCANNHINFTPEILINGQSYPKLYDRKDLIYFVEDLLEHQESDSWQLPLVETNNI